MVSHFSDPAQPGLLPGRGRFGGLRGRCLPGRWTGRSAALRLPLTVDSLARRGNGIARQRTGRPTAPERRTMRHDKVAEPAGRRCPAGATWDRPDASTIRSAWIYRYDRSHGTSAETIELAVLGLLHEGPMHGYELRKRLNLMLGWGRVLSYGSLYPTLKKMLRASSSRRPTTTPTRSRGGRASSTRSPGRHASSSG